MIRLMTPRMAGGWCLNTGINVWGGGGYYGISISILGMGLSFEITVKEV